MATKGPSACIHVTRASELGVAAAVQQGRRIPTVVVSMDIDVYCIIEEVAACTREETRV